MKEPDIVVTSIVITPRENLIIGYQENVNGKAIARLVSPEFINLPTKPPTDLGSIWD